MRSLVTASLVAFCSVAAMTQGQTSGSSPQTLRERTIAPVATEPEAHAVCGSACHLMPPADILPRAAWRDTIARMTLLMQNQPEPAGPPGTASRTVVLPPEVQRVLRYYEQNAPEQLPAPTPWPPADASQFHVRRFSPGDAPPAPAVAHVRFLDLDRDGHLEIVATEMRYGYIVAGDPARADSRLELIGTGASPARFEPLDWDGDGVDDLMVGDLGRFLPGDHTDGAILWLRGAKRLRYSRSALEGWPRVADVRGGDFNGDGKTDLIVAAFGWRKVGKVILLENQTKDYDRPLLMPHVVDSRPGAIHVIPAELNGDNQLDLVALISQQSETVVAYINTGNFTFKAEPIYTAPHPNWGSSGIELVDFDGDKDLDVLLAHGDTFDDAIIKPYHGIQWLENKGTYPFVAHHLADLPGVFGIKTGDLDGNGLRDVVACAFIANAANTGEADLPALVWLAQVRPGEFERRTLERSFPRHASLDLGDVDQDGDLDILVGNFAGAPDPKQPWVELWENRRVSSRASESTR
jgi:hypothetical protein